MEKKLWSQNICLNRCVSKLYESKRRDHNTIWSMMYKKKIQCTTVLYTQSQDNIYRALNG